MGNEHGVPPLTECRHEHPYEPVSVCPIGRKHLYCGVGIGACGRKHRLCFVFSNGPLESPAPLARSRTLTWEIKGFAYSDIHMTSELEVQSGG